MIPGLTSRNGHRNHIAERNTNGGGGGASRIKNLLVEEAVRWLHPDAVTIKEEKTEVVLFDLTVDDDQLSDDEE